MRINCYYMAGSTVWSGEFEKLPEDEIKLQSEIALGVANAFAGSLSGGEQNAISKRYTDSVGAMELYQRGRVAWSKRNREGMIEAERLFRNAIDEDPSFALAHVGLADTLALDSARSDELLVAIQKALELDPELAEPHASLGFFELFYKWNWRAAEDLFRKSISLNANYANAHQWYAQLLTIQGRHEEAKALMRRALEINPMSHNYLADMGQIAYFNREYSDAEAYCRRALEIYPDFVFARFYLYQIYLQTGAYESAVAEILAGERISISLPTDSGQRRIEIDQSIDKQREAFRKGGIDAFIRTRTNETHDGAVCYHNAKSYAFLGDRESALRCLEKASAERVFLAAFVSADPAFDVLRGDNRYREILRRMGLVP